MKPPTTMWPDSWPSWNSTLSRNRSAWITPRGSASCRCWPWKRISDLQQLRVLGARGTDRSPARRRSTTSDRADCPGRRGRSAPPGASPPAPRRPARNARASGSRTGAPSRKVTMVAGLPFSSPRNSLRRLAIGLGHGNAVAGQMRHQVQVERQLGRRQLLEQRQHEPAVGGGDEVVGVLDPGENALQVGQQRRSSSSSARPTAARG